MPATVNAAAPASSSTRSTLPAAHALVALFVVALNAAYEPCQTTSALATRAAGMAAAFSARRFRLLSRSMFPSEMSTAMTDPLLQGGHRRTSART